MSENIVEVHGITKEFTGVRALKGIDFSVRSGEVHALMGENGAGKSTLIKILTGLYQPTSGEIRFEGQKVTLPDVISAQKLGISTVYQELNMIPYLSVSENIFLGHYPMSGGGIDWKKMDEEAQRLIDEIGIDVDAKSPLRMYNTARQQLISIVRAVNFNCKLLILDEPTSSLDTKEVAILFDIVETLKKKGIAIIFISHRLDEVFKISDRITVLKDGSYMGTWNTPELSQLELLQAMIGDKNVVMERTLPYRSFENAKTVLEVKDLKRPPFVNGISFSVKEGEVLGMAGLLGAGRTETVRLIFGCDPRQSGEILIEGKPVNIHSPEDAVREGLAFCTENRREEGIFPDLSVENNIVICSLKDLLSGMLINVRKKKGLSEEYIQKLAVKTPSADQKIKYLSGGNQQKVILSRWLATKPKLIILDEPTRGIDVGAKAEIEALIREFSEEGISVIFVSSEMAELVRNCDRVIILRDGYQAGELTGQEISEANIVKSIAQEDRKEE